MFVAFFFKEVASLKNRCTDVEFGKNTRVRVVNLPTHSAIFPFVRGSFWGRAFFWHKIYALQNPGFNLRRNHTFVVISGVLKLAVVGMEFEVCRIYKTNFLNSKAMGLLQRSFTTLWHITLII